MIPTNDHISLREFRCNDCNKLMFKAILIDSEVEVKCKRCGKINIFKGEPGDKYLCYVYPCPHRITAQTPVPK